MNIKFENNDIKFYSYGGKHVAGARLTEYCSEDHGGHSMIAPDGGIVSFQQTMAPTDGQMVWIVNCRNLFSIARTIESVNKYVNNVFKLLENEP